MKNLVNLIIKTVLIIGLLYLLIPSFGESTVSQTLITGLALSIISYVVGDLWVLPKFGNFTALLADFGLALLLIWAMESALPQFELSANGLWIIALAITVGEWLLHLYFLATQAPGKRV